MILSHKYEMWNVMQNSAMWEFKTLLLLKSMFLVLVKGNLKTFGEFLVKPQWTKWDFQYGLCVCVFAHMQIFCNVHILSYRAFLLLSQALDF